MSNTICSTTLQHLSSNHEKPPKRTSLPIYSPSSINMYFGSQKQAVALKLAIETWIDNIINHPPLHPSVDPSSVFTENFSPVDELDPTTCEVIRGELPACLNGVYIRNGPNPQHIPRGPLHFFEGDGMLHSIQLCRGRAIYCNRYVKTYKYMREKLFGFAIFPNLFSGFYNVGDLFRFLHVLLRITAGHIDLMKGFGNANTSVAYLSSKLLALGESDLPYIVKVTKNGDLETLGRWGFDGKLFANMTAHPKYDVDTNEAFAFRYSPFFPYLTYFWFDENGGKQQDVPLKSIKTPTFIHDFAITKHFAIFIQTQLVITAKKMFCCKGMPLVVDPLKTSRIGVMSRYATNDLDIEWYDAHGFNPLHVINAWEDGDEEIILVAPNIVSLENMFHKDDEVNYLLEKVIINLKTTSVTRSTISQTKRTEMGTINPRYYGKTNRFVYLGVADYMSKMSGLVKIDLEKECEVSVRFYEQSCYGGEPMFVSRDETNMNLDEDDGFIISYLHNEKTGESCFIVMDAKSDELDIVAMVKLPRRVPYGLHGLFVSHNKLYSQEDKT